MCVSGYKICVCNVHSLTPIHDVQFCDHVHHSDQLRLHDAWQPSRLGQERGVSLVCLFMYAWKSLKVEFVMLKNVQKKV